MGRVRKGQHHRDPQPRQPRSHLLFQHMSQNRGTRERHRHRGLWLCRPLSRPPLPHMNQALKTREGHWRRMLWLCQPQSHPPHTFFAMNIVFVSVCISVFVLPESTRTARPTESILTSTKKIVFQNNVSTAI